GRSLPHVALTVRDEDGRVLGTGESGEVCVGAATDGPLAGVYTPFLGYWGRPDATEAALRDGVLHTGDVGFFGSDGTLFLEGRKNDMIIRGGSNVYAAEVERVLAFVQLAPGMAATPDELRRFSSGELARYKVPDEVRIVDELEVSTTGKVVKGPLRDLVRAATSG